MLHKIHRIVSWAERHVSDFSHYCYKMKKGLQWTIDAKERLKLLRGGYNGSNEEFKRIVLKYWGKYGVRPDKFWFDLYCDKKDCYDPRFIPNTMWGLVIIPYFNYMKAVKAYSDKAMLSHFLPDAKMPETVVKQISGCYYNGDGNKPISRSEAEALCRNEDHLIIKPSMGTKGQGIFFYDREAKGQKDISAIFDEMPTGFVAQRIVKQHPSLERINKSSLNTVRAISFRFKGKVHILSAQLRIGKDGARVDNVSAGGCACPIKPDGWLQEKAVNRQSKWTDSSPNGIKFKDIQVPNYAGVIDAIRHLHNQLPYFNIVGWDFSVDENNNPVLIEFNTMPGQNQIGCGEPTFGSMTDEVLEDVFIKKTLKDSFAR